MNKDVIKFLCVLTVNFCAFMGLCFLYLPVVPHDCDMCGSYVFSDTILEAYVARDCNYAHALCGGWQTDDPDILKLRSRYE